MSLRCDSPVLGYPLHIDSHDPLLHPHPLFTRILPVHDPALFDRELPPPSVLPPYASPTRRQSRFPSVASARNAVYLSDLDIDLRSPPSPSPSPTPLLDLDLDRLVFPLPPSSIKTAPGPPPSPEASRPSSLLSLAALAAPTRMYLALSDAVTPTRSHTDPRARSASCHDGTTPPLGHSTSTLDADVDHHHRRRRDIESRWSHSSSSLHELEPTTTTRKRLRSLISRLSGAPVAALAIPSPTTASSSASPLSLSKSTSRSSGSGSIIAVANTISATGAVRTAPPSPFHIGFVTGSCPPSPRTGVPSSRSLDGAAPHGVGDAYSHSRSTPVAPVSAPPHATYAVGTAPDTRSWTRKSGGGGRRAYNPALARSRPITPTTPQTGRGRPATASFFGGGPGLGLHLGATGTKAKSRMSLIGFRRDKDKDADVGGLVGKGKNKRTLVVSGLAPHDQMAFQAVRAWCEEFGELQNISRKENGSLHIDFRKRSVADTVCRVQAQVHIKGAGSVSLSWYTAKKNL